MATQYPELKAAFEKYDDTGEYLEQDLLYAVAELIEDGRAPTELQQAVDAYRKEVEEDFFVYAGRNDMDAAADAFVEAVRQALEG